jgi:hypothetical protein
MLQTHDLMLKHGSLFIFVLCIGHLLMDTYSCYDYLYLSYIYHTGYVFSVSFKVTYSRKDYAVSITRQGYKGQEAPSCSGSLPTELWQNTFTFDAGEIRY